MDKNKFMRSVRLKESACQGCINCIKHCPTQAIRVHNGKAHIIDKFCIDCGRCICTVRITQRSRSMTRCP